MGTDAARAKSEEGRLAALSALETGRYEEALSLYDGALELARETGDPAFADWIFACRAAAAVEVAPTDALLVELKSIVLRAKDPQTAFRAAYSGARIHELRHEYPRGVFYSRIARRHAEEIGDPVLLGHALNQEGILLTMSSRFDEAMAVYRLALSTTAERPETSPTWRAVWQDNLGYCLIALDRVDEGLPLVHEALETLEARGGVAYTLYPLMDLCFAYLKLDRYDEARFFGTACLERAERFGDPADERNLLYLLGEACHLSGDVAGASVYFDRLAAQYPDFKNLRAYLDVFDFRNVINLRS